MAPVVGSSELFGADGGTCACAAVHTSNSTKIKTLYIFRSLRALLQDEHLESGYGGGVVPKSIVSTTSVTTPSCTVTSRLAEGGRGWGSPPTNDAMIS